ncbi:hypothetical protein [Rufibacter sp. LB8]|nr:hypothetical protein [Rufibacter sp. LB8]
MDLNLFIKSNNLEEKDSGEVSYFIWDNSSSLSITDKINLSFQFFEENPSYGSALHWAVHYKEFSSLNKSIFWSKYKFYLNSNMLCHKEQIEYSLWVDFFGSSDTGDEAWEELINNSSNEKIIEAVLPISGPVPYFKKEELYFKLIADKKWHELILLSLASSFFDVYGSIDVINARKILVALEINQGGETYKIFNEYIFKYNSKEDYQEHVLSQIKHSKRFN